MRDSTGSSRAFSALLLAFLWGMVLSFPHGVTWPGDTVWQEAVGRWMLEHHQVMKHDVFSWTCRGELYINHSWLWDCALAALKGSFNAGVAYNVLFALPAGIGAVCVYLLLRRAIGGKGALPLSLAFSAVVAATPVWHMRPAMWGLALFCMGLVLALRGGRATWTLPALAALAANVHAGSALFQPAAAFLAPASRRSKFLLVCLTAAGLLINPWGLGMWEHVVVTALNPVFRIIPEWQSPSLPTPAGLGAVACGFLILPALRRRDPAALLAAVFLVAGVFSRRHLAFAFVVAATVMPPVRVDRRTTLVCLGVCLAVAVGHVLDFRGFASVAAVCEEPFPVQVGRAAEVLRLRGAEKPFCHPGVGDFLVGKIPVFADGRADFYARHGDWWKAGVEMSDLERDPADLKRWGCDSAVVFTSSPLDRYLQAAGWECALLESAVSVYFPKQR